MRLFIVRIASEKLLVDRFGAVEASLPVIEVAEETRRLDAFRMSRDKTRECIDRSIELPRGDQLARVEDRCLLVHAGVGVNRNDVRVLCPKRPRERRGQRQNRENQGSECASNHCRHPFESYSARPPGGVTPRYRTRGSTLLGVSG